MIRPSNDVLNVAAVAAIAALSILLGLNNPVLQVLLALPLVLIAPGYALTAAIFPRYALKASEQLLFTVGLSLAITALGGLMLHLTLWGLQARSWAIFLFAVTLAAAVIALIRRRRGFAVGTIATNIGLGPGQIVLFGLAALIIAGAIGLARIPAPPEGHQGYSPLWLQPLGRSHPNQVRVGVANYEFTSVEYRLRVEVNGQTVGQDLVFNLKPGQAWDTTLSIEQLGSGPVKGLLYRQDAPGQVYRQVLWRPENP